MDAGECKYLLQTEAIFDAIEAMLVIEDCFGGDNPALHINVLRDISQSSAPTTYERIRRNIALHMNARHNWWTKFVMRPAPEHA